MPRDPASRRTAPRSVGFVGTHDPTFTRNALVAEGLAARGFAVTHTVEPSWGSTADRVRAARRGWRNPGLAGRLIRAYVRLSARLRAQRAPDVLYAGYPGQLDVLGLRALAPAIPIVLDAFVALDETLADRGLGSPVSSGRILARILDRLAFRAADLVVVDTAAHARRFASDYGLDLRRTVIVPVGSRDPGAEARGVRADGPDATLRALYFGGFIPLHGVGTILDAARLLGPSEGIHIDLVGDGQEADAVEQALVAEQLPQVRLVRTWMPEAELVRAHIRHADVCLGIFGATPKALDVVPAKVYLALACGRPVLTANTPAIREEILTRDPSALATCPPGDAAALADRLRSLRDAPDERGRLGRAGRALYERGFRPGQIVEPLVPALAALAASARR